ncbi:hypothetical protein ACTFQF_18160 [Aliivibrio fischeri]|uniref:Uncharacterized protein n=4 Tax=Aliivibrio fischeri TaxID=668 RepID=Q5E0P9_ALIF1|nr:hypothetical protein [Aliivibrio fischeri]AAW87397.1 hypothetical protein VF_A0327 [Aliivibrio fischeri ES114]ACH64432.1 conserved hypothetical protein [Aliivibrio fischeri MJ11]EHN69029.1 hypothetical protein VFSR5_A0328 [Aliivibrio fischeri SR5]KLU77968.1 hypothetical protein AB192_14640 [Aliivibrio fischeri]MBP3139319.1 hypothetical protein [Aliivibrio fischeri]
MFKIFALLFIALGIYIGMNYGDEVQSVMDSDAFEQVQDTLVDGKDLVIEKIEDAVQ